LASGAGAFVVSEYLMHTRICRRLSFENSDRGRWQEEREDSGHKRDQDETEAEPRRSPKPIVVAIILAVVWHLHVPEAIPLGTAISNVIRREPLVWDNANHACDGGDDKKPGEKPGQHVESIVIMLRLSTACHDRIPRWRLTLKSRTNQCISESSHAGKLMHTRIDLCNLAL
jgi:hypothetical protein